MCIFRQYFTYNVVRPRIRFNASPGTTVRPQLCNDKRFNLCKPINASESIFDIVLSDSTLKNENVFDWINQELAWWVFIY